MTLEEARTRISAISYHALTILAISKQSPEYSAERHIEGMQDGLEIIHSTLERLYIELGGKE